MAGYLFKFLRVFISFEFTNVKFSRFIIKTKFKVSFHAGISSFLLLAIISIVRHASISTVKVYCKNVDIPESGSGAILGI